MHRTTQESMTDATATANTPPAVDDGNLPAPLTNRVFIVMTHTSRYSTEGQARLAANIGVSRSTISRLLRGKTRPSYRLVQAVTTALETALKRPLDPRELFSPDGSYPTPSGCALCGCKGCTPAEAYDRRGNLKPAFRNMKPGDWSLSPQNSAIVQRSATLPVTEHR
jgi:DNA-binding XRE family transcriptional regulator